MQYKESFTNYYIHLIFFKVYQLLGVSIVSFESDKRTDKISLTSEWYTSFYNPASFYLDFDQLLQVFDTKVAPLSGFLWVQWNLLILRKGID